MSAPSMKSATLLISTPLLTQERVLRALRQAASALPDGGPVQPGDLMDAAPALDAARLRALLEALAEVGWVAHCGAGFRPVDRYPEDPPDEDDARFLVALRHVGCGLPVTMGLWLLHMGQVTDLSGATRRVERLVASGHVRELSEVLYLPERP